MLKMAGVSLFLVTAFIALPVYAEVMSAETLNPTAGSASTQISVDKMGNVLVENLKVFQLAGKTFFPRAMWGQTFLRVLVRTTATTKLMRLDGTPISASDIKVGDMLNVKGVLDSGGDSFSLNATALKDTSLQQRDNALFGKVTAMATTSTGFILATVDKRSINVHIGTSTVITKGTRTISAGDVAVGNMITSAIGVYDPATNTLQATKIIVYIDMRQFKAQNFQGTLASLPDTSARTVQMNIKGTTYTVRLTSDAKIIDKKGAPANLARFIVGDTIRCYGAIQESNILLIEAEVLRNVNL